MATMYRARISAMCKRVMPADHDPDRCENCLFAEVMRLQRELLQAANCCERPNGVCLDKDQAWAWER